MTVSMCFNSVIEQTVLEFILEKNKNYTRGQDLRENSNVLNITKTYIPIKYQDRY